jgi:sugar-specific transcriptional regulator TrmB
VADDRVYQLRTPSQVYERCRAILGSARHIVLLDVFAAPLAELRESVEQAIMRGVKVALMVYEQTELPKAEVVLNHQASIVRARWSGQWVNLAADSAEQVHALMSPDGSEVLHATCSASAFLAHLYQSGLLGEMSASVLRNAIGEDMSQTEVLRRSRCSPVRRCGRRGRGVERDDSTAVEF